MDTLKPKPVKNKKYMLVRYGYTGTLGWFEHTETTLPRVHIRVVIKTERGLELGELVGPHCYKAGQFKFNPEQVNAYFGPALEESPINAAGQFVRFANSQDLIEEKHLNQSAKEEMQCCRKFAEELKLPMKIIAAEHLFGGERIVIYFLAEGRIDFRELVKRLAKEYQTRIEMRQIGARDEAKLMSDYEVCGMECCCRKFLKILKPVNMKMAKLQKATLDPSKISGHCGRLKCCLRYEDQTYEDLRKKLPRKGSFVKTSNGDGKVIDLQLLTQLVVVQTAEGTIFAVPAEEVQIIRDSAPARRPNEPDNEQDSAPVEQTPAEPQKPEPDIKPDDTPETDTTPNEG